MKEKFNSLLLTLLEGFDEDRTTAESGGYIFVDKREVGEFEVSLFKTDPSHPMGKFYQVGLNVKGSGFFSDQGNRDVAVNKNFIKDFREVVKVIELWLNEHSKMIRIGSNTKSKTLIYKKMIERYTDMSTGDIVDNGYFNYFNVTL